MKRMSVILFICLATTGCRDVRAKPNSINDLDINNKNGEYLHNIDSKSRLLYKGSENITGENLVSFRYYDYNGEATTELFPLSGSWNSTDLNSNGITLGNSTFNLNLDTDVKSDKVQLSYIIDNGVFSLVYWGVDGTVSYNIYKNGFLFATVNTASFSNFNLENTDSLIVQGSEIVAKQNDNLSLYDSFYVKPVFSDGTEGEQSNVIDVKTVASNIPVELADDILKIGVKLDNPKDLPREVKVKLLDGSVGTYNIDYKLDEATRFTDKIYYKYYINNTNLRGFVEVNLSNSFNIPSTIENGSLDGSDLESLKLTIKDNKDTSTIKLLDLNSYMKTATPKLTDKKQVYEDIYQQLKARKTEVDLWNYSLSKADFIEIVEQLELDFYYIINSLTLDRNSNKIYIDYNSNEIQSFDSVETAFNYVNENGLINGKEISSLISLSLPDTKSVKGIRLGQIRYFNVVKSGENYYNVDFSKSNREMFMCSDEQMSEMGYTKNNNFMTYSCTDTEQEYYKVNSRFATGIDEYREILKREISNGSYDIRVKYIGEDITSSQVIDIISSVFDELNKRDLLSRVRFADSNKIYTIRIGE